MDTNKVQKELIFELMLFVTGLILVLILFTKPLLLTILLLGCWLFGLRNWYRDHDVYFFLFGMIIGPLVEILGVSAGVWEFTKPGIFGIPLWSPFVWGYAIMLVKRHAEIYLNIEMKVNGKAKRRK